MRLDKQLYVLAQYDGETEAKIAGWQQRLYDAGFTGWQTPVAPHITLGSAPVEKEAEMRALVEKAAAEIAPFPITFNHWGVFGGGQILFVAPDPNRELFALKEYFGAIENWTPHTTLLYDEAETVYRAIPVLAADFSAFYGRVESLYLYEFSPSRLICRADLRGRSLRTVSS